MLSKNKVGFIALLSLFFLWALAHNLNPILIPQLKKALVLSDFQSAWVDSSFYIAYFLMALPAGKLIERLGYRGTIVTGLVLFAAGAWLFIPAADWRSYPVFLGALFVLASGLTFLETAANPFVSIMGDSASAGTRLNFAQAFNGLGATLAAFFGSRFILSGVQANSLSSKQADLTAWLEAEASQVKAPYFFIGLIVLLVAIVFLLIPLPTVAQEKGGNLSFRKLFALRQVKLAVIAQFFYVGAQVGVSGFFIRYAGSETGLNDRDSALGLSVALFLFMAGRFAGSALMRIVKAELVLKSFAWASLVCVGIAILLGGKMGLGALILAQFFMSIMFPTIFSLGIQQTGELTRYASSLLIMSIAGGAFLPPIMGAISDVSGIRFAYLVPLFCFGIIAILTPKIKP